MITIHDGPAQGQAFEVRRAPALLRLVEEGGRWDALDQLEDRPTPRENIAVYLRMGKAGMTHICASRKAGGCRWMASAVYRLYDYQPDPLVARDNGLWRAWCQEQRARLMAKEQA